MRDTGLGREETPVNITPKRDAWSKRTDLTYKKDMPLRAGKKKKEGSAITINRF